jgi:CBS domain-containing protein
MELYALPFFIFAALLLISVGIAQGCGKSKSEDEAQYEHFNPRVKLVQEVHHKEPTPLQTTDSAVTVGKKPEKAAVSGHDLGETTSVHSVMVKKAHFCFESQSVDEARRIMREHDLPYLLVLDKYLRIVGTVRMRDLMLGDEDRPQSGG